MALLITGGNGDPASQANTQSPQTSAGAGGPVAASAKSVQPGTTDSLLKGSVGGSDGIPLTSTALPVADLNVSTQTAAQPTTPASRPAHHLSTVWLIIVGVIAVTAVLSFWLVGRSVKNTTDYQ